MPKKRIKKQPQKIREVFEQFIDNLIVERGLEKMEPDILVEIKKDLQTSLERRMNAALVAKIPPEKLDAFDALLDKGEAQAIQEFFRTEIPDFRDVIAQELLAFRRTYLTA